MSKFGWSYPPGAANDPNAPYNQTDDVTELQDAILGLLEDAGIETEINNAIMALVKVGENYKRFNAQWIDKIAREGEP